MSESRFAPGTPVAGYDSLGVVVDAEAELAQDRKDLDDEEFALSERVLRDPTLTRVGWQDGSISSIATSALKAIDVHPACVQCGKPIGFKAHTGLFACMPPIPPDPRDAELSALRQELAGARRQKDGAYSERDQVVAGFATLARALGWPVWLATHVGEWEDDWRNIVFVETPYGQMSWHYHDSERPWFSSVAFDSEPKPWDGHSTSQKYERLRGLVHDGIAEHVPAGTCDAMEARLSTLEADLAEAAALLARAHADVCSLRCPSVKKTGEDWTHVGICAEIRTALAPPSAGTGEGRPHDEAPAPKPPCATCLAAIEAPQAEKGDPECPATREMIPRYCTRAAGHALPHVAWSGVEPLPLSDVWGCPSCSGEPRPAP